MAKKSATATAQPAAKAEEQQVLDIPLASPNATSRLFPDNAPSIPEEEVMPAPAPVAPPETPAAPVEPQAPTSPQPPDDSTFIEDLLAKSNIPLEKVKVRIKVDGKDEVLSYADAKMRVQLKEHLNLAGQELGDKRRAFADERQKFLEEQRAGLNLGAKPNASPTPADPYSDNADPLVSRLFDEVKMLRERVAGLDPVVFQNNRQKVSNELKSQGFGDFLDYIPKMESHIAGLKDPHAIEYYDSEIGSKALYHELKNRDLMEQMNRKPSPAIPSARPATPEPPIIRIDGGSQPSQVGIDNYDANYEDTLTRWKQTRDPKLFRQILAMRGAA